jgi:hypothetical protein
LYPSYLIFPFSLPFKGRENESARLFRDADTIEMESSDFARMLWNRVESVLTGLEVVVTQDDADAFGKELVGNWLAVDTNSDLLFAKYPSGGHFAPHTDGCAIQAFNIRSWYSIIVFLNDIPEGMGGGTRFYERSAVGALSTDQYGRWTCDASLMTTEVQPKAGRMLIFDQSLVHEGVPPSLPHTKYIIRSDLMFHRSPEILNTPDDIAAYRIYREGENLAEAGKYLESIVKMKEALRLSPALKDILNL